MVGASAVEAGRSGVMVKNDAKIEVERRDVLIKQANHTNVHCRCVDVHCIDQNKHF